MRRRVAFALCVLWIVGFELMPWMHIAMHDRIAPHYHTATGATVYLAEGETPPPGAHVHTHVYPAPPSQRAATRGDAAPDDASPGDAPDDGQSRLRAALAHGDHALAHHGIAIPVPPPVRLEPLPTDRRPIALAVAAEHELVSRDPLAPRARGPPSVPSA